MQSPISQDQIFLTEGDQWFRRNQGFLVPTETRDDAVSRFLRSASFAPKRFLDIGCANGYALDYLVRLFPGASGDGIEPSAEAVQDGQTRFPHLRLTRGVSHDLRAYADGQFDCITATFILHWVDRAQLWNTVAEIDRVLADGGHLLIADFAPPTPCKTRYHHLPDQAVYTYKQAYWELFTASPRYAITQLQPFTHDGGADTDPMNRCMLAVLEKRSLDAAYPLVTVGNAH
jgi:SAM-dependent methyltransferase